MGKTEIQKIAYLGWKNCLELKNGIVRCIVTTDIGPRVIHYSLADGENEFYVNEADAGRAGDTEYRFYGGHRLWHGPQVEPRCVLPDNDPVDYDLMENGVRLTQKTEAGSHIQKIMEITLEPDSSRVTVKPSFSSWARVWRLAAAARSVEARIRPRR